MRRTIICRETIYYLAVIALVFLGAIMREVNLLLLFGSLLICPVFIAWRLERRTMRDLAVRRKKPVRVVAGEVFHVPIELTNRRRRLSSWAVIVEDGIQRVRDSSLAGHSRPGLVRELRKLIQSESKTLRPAVYYEYVKAGETKKKNYSGCISRRGRYKLGPMVASTRFPIGFFRTTVQFPEKSDSPEEFVVLPRPGILSARWFSRQHQSEAHRRPRRFRISRGSGEFLGVRHWQSGDIKKWVHWRASAKHDEPVVRLYEQHQNRDAAILLDLYRPDSLTIRDWEHIELAVSFAATLINELARRSGANLLLGTYDAVEGNKTEPRSNGDRSNGNRSSPRPEISGQKSDDGSVGIRPDLMVGQVSAPLVDGMLERLAVIESSKFDGLAELLRRTLSTVGPNADLFLVSPGPIDLTASRRLRSLRDDPRLRTLAQRIRVIDVSDASLAEFFSLE